MKHRHGMACARKLCFPHNPPKRRHAKEKQKLNKKPCGQQDIDCKSRYARMFIKAFQFAKYCCKFSSYSTSDSSLYLCKRGFYLQERVCLHQCYLKVCVSWKASSQRTCAVIAIFLESLSLWENSIPCENMLT